MPENNAASSATPNSPEFVQHAAFITPDSSRLPVTQLQHMPANIWRQPRTVGTPSASPPRNTAGLPTHVLSRLRAQLETERDRRIALEAALEEMKRATASLQQRIAALTARRERRDASEIESAGSLQRELAGQLSRARDLERLLASAERAREQQFARLERANRKIESVEKRANDQRLEFERTLLSMQHSLTSTAQALADSESKNEILSREVSALKNALNEHSSENAKSEIISVQSRAKSVEEALCAMREENRLLKAQLDAIRSTALAEEALPKLQQQNRLLTAELDAIRSAALSEKLTMQDYVQVLQDEVRDLRVLREERQHLVMQAEDAIAAMQAEGAALTTLIDVVQASHFWKLKRIARKALAKILRRRT